MHADTPVNAYERLFDQARAHGLRVGLVAGALIPGPGTTAHRLLKTIEIVPAARIDGAILSETITAEGLQVAAQRLLAKLPVR